VDNRRALEAIALHWRLRRYNGGLGQCSIEVTRGSGAKQFYTVSTSSSYLSDRRIIAGLGSETVVNSVVIRWPSGIIQRLANLEIDRMLKIEEPPR